MEQNSPEIFVTKESIKQEKRAMLKVLAFYLVGFVLCACFVYKFIYTPFLAPADTWQKKSVVLCALKLDNFVEAQKILEQAYSISMKYEFNSLQNYCGQVFEEDLKNRGRDHRYKNLHDNKDRLVREMYYVGLYDEEALLQKSKELN